MDYVGMFFIKQKKQHEFVQFIKMSLETVCRKVHTVTNAPEQDMYQALKDMIISREIPDDLGMIIVTDDCFGPLFPLTDVFIKVNKMYDLWGIDYDVETSFEKHREILRKEFCVVEPKLLHNAEFINLVKDAGDTEDFQNKLYDFVAKYKFCMGTYIKRSLNLDDKKELDPWKYLPYETLKMGTPFLPVQSFDIGNTLRYSIQHEPRRAMKYIREKYSFNGNLIWDYLLTEYNISDIKKYLQLEFAVPDNSLIYPIRNKHRIAMFFHLYYLDKYDQCLDYIKHVPKNIDVYISVTDEGRPILEAKLNEYNIDVASIISAGKRGRDAGALLVGFREYIDQYEYICFIHDKKSSGGLAPASEGKSFMDLIWDNLVLNKTYIENMIGLLEHEEKLGIIAPPIPNFGTYLKNLVGAEWTICYEATENLSKKLQVNIDIDKGKLPYILSTCFWCKTKALRALFRYDWKWTDFPEEPINLDGEINHAIERILPYLAQKEGYYSAIAYNLEYASLYTSNQMYLLDDFFKEIHKNSLIGPEVPFKFSDTIQFMIRLNVFICNHPTFYVYGAGAQARILKEKLNYLKLFPKSFLVSDKKGNAKEIGGIIVEEFNDIAETINKSAGIVIALSNGFLPQIIPMLEEYSLDYFAIDVE